MTTIQQRIVALAQAIGGDIKQLNTAQGDLSALPTTAKANLVAAITELYGMANGTVRIDDLAGDGAVGVTWSADKIHDTIVASKQALKDELVNGAGEALDTLAELGAALGNNPDFAGVMTLELANRVRFDAAQTLTNEQKDTARSNIGAASQVALEAEATARNAAVAVLSQRVNAARDDITSEVGAREAADTALGGRITALEGQVGGNVGDVSALKTTDKSSVVAAVNELVAKDLTLLATINGVNDVVTDHGYKFVTIQNSVGLNPNLTLTPFDGANYIAGAANVRSALLLLDTAIATGVSGLTADVAALTTAVGTGEEDFADIYNTAKA